jgi:hypothetical protein
MDLMDCKFISNNYLRIFDSSSAHIQVNLNIIRGMGANLSKFQGVLRFELHILPTGILKSFKTADDKEPTPKTQGTNGMELQCVHSPLPLLNSENLHIKLNRFHCLSKN